MGCCQTFEFTTEEVHITESIKEKATNTLSAFTEQADQLNQIRKDIQDSIPSIGLEQMEDFVNDNIKDPTLALKTKSGCLSVRISKKPSTQSKI